VTRAASIRVPLTVRRHALRLAIGSISALGICRPIHAVLEQHWADPVWTAGALLGQALSVESPQTDVDWGAIEREVEANERPAAEAPPSVVVPRVAQPSALKSKPGASGTKGVFLSTDQVLRLSKLAKIPASRFVERQGERPAGLQVAGVSGLGIGVKDGDVLTQVAGSQVSSSTAVVSTVLQLRAKRAPAISGEFWRGQERYQIMVQMPYVTAQPQPAGSVASRAVPSLSQPQPAVSEITRN
jgi:hypothetical protein